MELSGNRFGILCGVTRNNIYILTDQGRLVKTEPGRNGKWESTEPTNANYLREHGVHPETCEPLSGKVAKPIAKTKQAAPKKSTSQRSRPKKATAKEKPTPKSSAGQKQTKASQEKNTVGSDDKYFDPRERDDITGAEFEQLTGLPEKMLNLTLKEAILKYGSMHNLKQQTDMLKSLMSARDTDVRTSEKRKELIPREFVEGRIKTHIELERSQFFDYPEAQIDIIISEVLADPEEARRKIPENMLRDFSKIFQETERQISKQLNDLRAKYDRQDEQQLELIK